MSATNDTGLNMVTQLMSQFMNDDFSTKTASEDEDKEKEKDDKKKDDEGKGDDKKPMTKDELADYEKKEHGGKMPSKEDEEKEKKASVADLLARANELPPELQKLANLAAEKNAELAAKKASQQAPVTQPAVETTTKEASAPAETSALEKFASGALSDADFFNECFYDETAKLASEHPGYAEILNEKFAQIQAAGQPTSNTPEAGV